MFMSSNLGDREMSQKLLCHKYDLPSSSGSPAGLSQDIEPITRSYVGH